ncbi:SOS response-associated peptidase [Chondromyces crocatus]|uniref:Abasic site processing protein n=1 Tax=Chondromyces crocatus TaxID=52 RepID=A0A0K1E752_CHOCO|nr:SOS response-associated peptidase [Chondromyces crocatus]AKT36408.1 uncharacterized protein CMC5_005210 [Chondromyces crocatus]
MCARYTLTVPDFGALAQALLVPLDDEIGSHYRPHFNIAPGTTQLILHLAPPDRDENAEEAVVSGRTRGAGPRAQAPRSGRAGGASAAGGRVLVEANWGLLNRWVKDPAEARRHVNARAEGVREKPSFREAFARRRCVIPADGFYEWTGPKGARQPVWFHPQRGGLLHLAGLHETWHDPTTGEGFRTFVILTTAANDVVAPLHDRMPVLLAPEDVDAWLDVEGSNLDEVEALMRPAPAKVLALRPVSRRVNTTREDDPGLLDAVEEEAEAPREASPARSAAGTHGAPAGRGGAVKGRGKKHAVDDGQLALPLFGEKPGRG